MATLFARVFDLYTFVPIFGIILSFILPNRETAREYSYLFYPSFVAAYLFFEAICLNAFGITLGKFVYGIRIVDFVSAVLGCAFDRWHDLDQP
jgi:uncharacterized RDD family membrane protein YckC